MFNISPQMIIVLVIIFYNVLLVSTSPTSLPAFNPGSYDRCWKTLHTEPFHLPTSNFTISQSCYNPYFKVFSYQATADNHHDPQQGIILSFKIDNDSSGTYISFVRCNDVCQWQDVSVVDDDLTNQLSRNVIYRQLQINITCATNFLILGEVYSELYCYDIHQIAAHTYSATNSTNSPLHHTTAPRIPSAVPTTERV